MRKPRTIILALLAAVAAVAAAQQEGTASGSQDDGSATPSIDWLVEEFWHSELKDGLLTMNVDDLERFVPTGRANGQFVIGPLKVEQRAAVLIASESNPERPFDIPASVVVSVDGKVVVGAKGFEFDTEVDAKQITITHWNGEPGCSVSNWYLEYEIEGEVRFAGSTYTDFISGRQCKRG